MTMLEKEQRELTPQRRVQRFPKRKAPWRRTGLWVGAMAAIAVLAVGLATVVVATGGDEPQPTLGIAGEPEALQELYDLIYPAAADQVPVGEDLVEGLVRQGAIPAETLERPTLEDLHNQTHGATSPPQPEGLVEQLVRQGSIPAKSLDPYRALAIDPLQDLYYQTHGGTSHSQPEGLVEQLVRQGSIPAETLE
jgi:hypothetical protein